MSKVSICIPAYSDVYGICRLLNSIIKQNYRYFEIIITDDTPDDSVEAIVKTYAPDGILLEENGQATGIHLTYIHNESSLGPAGNWNKAISLAGNEYIKIMHQDDCFTDENSLKHFVDMLDSNEKAILAFSGSRQVTLKESDPYDLTDYYDRCILDEHKELISKDWRNLFLGGYIGAPSAVIYRNCDVRFDPKLKWLIDGDFYMNLLSKGDSTFECTRKPLVCIGMSHEQLTNSCVSDSEVNISEHRYLYSKYNLSDRPEYAQKLVDVIVDYKGSYSNLSDLGIDKSLYDTRKKEADKKKRQFYVQLILRKLHLRKD